MLKTQKVLAGLLILFLVGGIVTFLIGDSGLTGAVFAEGGTPPDYAKSSGLFCYRSYFCQAGIECMYLDKKEPFCTQPAAFDRKLGQKHGEPCFINIQGQVECPFVKAAPMTRAAAFEEGEKQLIETSRGFIG